MLGRDLAHSLLLLPPCLFAQTVVFSTLTPGITCGITSAKLVEWGQRSQHGLQIVPFRAAEKVQSASEYLLCMKMDDVIHTLNTPALNVTALNNENVVPMKSCDSVSSQVE